MSATKSFTEPLYLPFLILLSIEKQEFGQIRERRNIAVPNARNSS